MKEVLKNKNILFFAPSFFGYEEKIKTKMIEMGANVNFFDERSVVEGWKKGLLKINPNIFKKRTNKYYYRILNKLKDIDYDYIFFIKCEMVTKEILEYMRSIFPKSQFILYLYDSLSNLKNIQQKLLYFDNVYSFDRIDCLNNKSLEFRPLFFCDEYKSQFTKEENFKYDLCFIGTIHSDRYKVLNEIRKEAEINDLNIYIYPYLQSKIVYFFYKLVKKEFRYTKLKEFVFKKKSSTEIAQIISNSRIIIDIQHKNQTGLTMRTIEMIGMRKKIITTNKDIVNYNFYNPNNILVVDRSNFKFNSKFLEQSYKKLDESIYNEYSLENWIKTVLGDDLNENSSNRS